MQIAAIVIIVIALAVLPAEWLSRWWIRKRRRYYVMPAGLRVRIEMDRDVFPQLEPVTRFEVNTEGERGNEVPRVRHGLYRVLVAGGSQPEGFLLDQATMWPGGLERLLDTPDARAKLGAARVHVGSIARSGVGAEALDLIFDRVLPRYRRLSLVIVLVGATDVLRWLEFGAPSVLPPVRTADVFRSHPEAAFGWRPGTLATGELLRRARRRWLRTVHLHPHGGRWIGEARAMRARADVRTTVPDPAPMLEHFTRHFTHAIVSALVQTDRLIVIPQPWFAKEFTVEEAAHMWHGGAGQVWRSNVTTFYSFDVVSQLMRLVSERTSKIIAALGVEELDLMSRLDASLDTYYDCFHLTPAGARQTASIVTAAVLQEQERQPRATAATTSPTGAGTQPCVDLRV